MTHTTPEPTSILRLRSPQDVLVAVPHLLGFQPTDCLVAILLVGSRHRVRVTVRLDLPEHHLRAEWTDAAVQRIEAALAETEACELILLAYSRNRDDAEIVRQVAERMRAHPHLEIRDVLLVTQERWWSVTCSDSTCCPADGRELPDPAASPVHAEMIGRGSAPADGREEVVTRYQADPESTYAREFRDLLEMRADAPPAPITTVRERRDVIAHIGRTLVDHPDRDHDAETWVGIARGLADIRVRDVILRRLVLLSRDDGQHVRAVEERVRLAAISVPRPWSPGLAGLLAALTWLRGDGVAARAACDLALSAEPDYSLAHLLHRVMDAGMSPERWTRAILAMSEDACLHGVAA